MVTATCYATWHSRFVHASGVPDALDLTKYQRLEPRDKRWFDAALVEILVAALHTL